MEPQIKMRLSEHLKNILADAHGSIAAASIHFDIPYDNLKKALRTNKFSRSNLELLFPRVTPEELAEKFAFDLRRIYVRDGSTEERFLLVMKRTGLQDEDVKLILENRAFAERITKIVSSECQRFRKVVENFEEVGGAT